MRRSELIFRSVENETGGEFAEQILSDLITEGFSGEELLQKFKERQAKVRPAVEAMIAQAKGAAQGTEAYESYEELKQYMKDNNFSMEIPTYMYSSVEEESDYTMICHITDWHIGYIINNCNGNNFNWEIANERINKYISECKKYIELYNIRQVLVISTGDMIENSYMRETQAHNCEFLQSMQIHKATKLIYSLLVALAEDCNVIFGGIAGNHDRMSGDKKKNYEGDNANVLITEHIKDLVDVSGCERISILDTNYNDSEINITVAT